MNVRELVTVLKFKTDNPSMKSAENAINRVKTMMAKIQPATIKMNTGGATRQIEAMNKRLGMVTGQKKLKITTDTTGIDRTISKLKELDRQQQRTAQGFFRGKARGLAQGAGQVGQAGKQPSMMPSLGGLKTMFAMLGGMALVHEIKQEADAMMNLSSRIKIVTKTDEERLQVERELYNLSQKNRTSLTSVGDLYYKIAQASEKAGVSQKDLLRVVDITSKALTVGGADTNQKNATILQLSQALGSGVLQGDELRSLRENAPELMKQIAKYYGTDPGGLKELGAKGLLKSNDIIKAILAGGDAVDEKFKQVTPTIDQALTVLGNKFSKLIMDIQNNTGVFGTIAGIILDGVELMGKAIDWVVDKFGTATPEMKAMIEDFKGLWDELKPAIMAIGTIINNWVVPALKVFHAVAFSVLGMMAKMLQPVANLLSRIAELIATASSGFGNLIAKAESGAKNQYTNIMRDSNNFNQTNTFNVNSIGEAKQLLVSPQLSLHP